MHDLMNYIAILRASGLTDAEISRVLEAREARCKAERNLTQRIRIQVKELIRKTSSYPEEI